MSKKHEARISDAAAAFGGGIAGRAVSQPYADASDAMVEGMRLFLQGVASGGARPVDKLQGNLFEYIEAAKFNVDAALKRAPNLEAVVTAATGQPAAKADITIDVGGSVVREVQAKSSEKASDTTFALSDPAYRGMMKLTPHDQADRVRELAGKRAATETLKAEDYADTQVNVTGNLKHGDVASPGTTRAELRRATANPRAYAAAMETGRALKEVGVSAAAAGGTAAAVGGFISIVKNGVTYRQGAITGEEARGNVVEETARAGAKGAGTGGLSAGIRLGASKLGIKALQNSNVATTLAVSAIDIGVSVYAWGKGEITTDELVEQVGETGVCATTGFWVGASAGAVFGPAGAIVGSMAGYLVAAQVYESALGILKGAELAREEADRIVRLSEEACAAMEAQRREFEAWVAENLQAYSASFRVRLEAVDRALAEGRCKETLEATAGLAGVFGQELLFKSQEEFDQFMLTRQDPLVL